MNVWLLKDGENLPVQTGARLMRTGALAAALSEVGHQATWWSSTFSHQRKQLLFKQDKTITLSQNHTLRLLNSGSYSKNISVKRALHHRKLAAKFAEAAERMAKPDVIVCAFPFIDLAYEAVRYASANHIPIIVDVRDLWPDIFLDKSPKLLRPLVKHVLRNQFKKTETLLAASTSIVATSEGFLSKGLAYAGRQKTQNDKVFYLGYREPNEPTEPLPDYLANEHHKKIISFVGTFGQSYYLENMLDAAHTLQDHGRDDILFLIAGDGEKATRLKERSKGLSNVKMLGWLAQDEIHQLLSVSNVGIIPCQSMENTIPNKLSEYLAYGLPVLSSITGETEQIIQKHQVGLHYDVNSSESLVLAIKQIFDTPGLNEVLANNASKLYKQQFCLQKIQEEYVNHIETIALSWKHK